jgi:cytochrome c-type biogenesis protein
MSGGSLLFGFVAGLLSILSPCVLPLLPLIFGGAASASRLGVVALAAGLMASFVVVGLFIATVGFSIGLDADWFRAVSAVLLGLVGVVLLSGVLQRRLSIAGGGLSDASDRLMQRLSPHGLWGQFGIGAVLGAAWSPCVGPTLGAASLLAAQGRDLVSVGAVMAAFALGAAVPLLVVATLSRQVLQRWRGGLAAVGRGGRVLLGVSALGVCVLILTGGDRALETVLVANSPGWLIDITTRF